MAGGDECSWYEFAKAIFERAGMSCRGGPGPPRISRPGRAPAHGVLRSERGRADPPPLAFGLDRYLVEREAAGARA